jgi:NitT/TauT family transport system substrate-binding protein
VAASSPDATASAAPVVVKVASGQGVYRAAVDVGMARGYFDAENIKIEIQKISTGPEQVPLMASGQIDVAFTGPSAAHFNALAAGVPVRFVAPCGTSSPDSKVPNGVFMVRKALFDSGEVTSVKDFAGHKIGTPNKQSKGFVDLVTLLKKEGLSEKDVEVVAPLSFPDAAAALAGGALDAAFLVEPFATLGKMKGEAVAVAGDNDIMSGRLGCVLAYGKQMIENKELGDRFMRAYLRGARDYQDAFFKDKGKAEIVAIEIGVTPVKDASLFDKMAPNYIDPNGEINPESLKLDIAVYLEKGYVRNAPDLAEVLEAGFSERAVASLGRYDVG